MRRLLVTPPILFLILALSAYATEGVVPVPPAPPHPAPIAPRHPEPIAPAPHPPSGPLSGQGSAGDLTEDDEEEDKELDGVVLDPEDEELLEEEDDPDDENDAVQGVADEDEKDEDPEESGEPDESDESDETEIEEPWIEDEDEDEEEEDDEVEGEPDEVEDESEEIVEPYPDEDDDDTGVEFYDAPAKRSLSASEPEIVHRAKRGRKADRRKEREQRKQARIEKKNQRKEERKARKEERKENRAQKKVERNKLVDAKKKSREDRRNKRKEYRKIRKINKIRIRCQGPAVRGPCDKHIKRFFYDEKSDSCKQFDYGGCVRRDNNWIYQRNCVRKCVKNQKPKPKRKKRDYKWTDPIRCKGPPQPGPCKRSIRRHYYDPESDSCKPFNYGGCNRQPNNWNFKGNCIRLCVKKKPEPKPKPGQPNWNDPKRCSYKVARGTCQKKIKRFYYDQDSNTCKRFVYTGCNGNVNRFRFRGNCRRVCKQKKTIKWTNKKRCEKKVDPGPCKAAIKKFAYDPESDTCRAFTYGGCKGNNNRFGNVRNCNRVCVKDKSKIKPDPNWNDRRRCLAPVRRGPCSKDIKRYFYDAKSNTCKRFSYSGCKRTPNNWWFLKNCRRVCVNKSPIEPPIEPPVIIEPPKPQPPIIEPPVIIEPPIPEPPIIEPPVIIEPPKPQPPIIEPPVIIEPPKPQPPIIEPPVIIEPPIPEPPIIEPPVIIEPPKPQPPIIEPPVIIEPPKPRPPIIEPPTVEPPVIIEPPVPPVTAPTRPPLTVTVPVETVTPKTKKPCQPKTEATEEPGEVTLPPIVTGRPTIPPIGPPCSSTFNCNLRCRYGFQANRRGCPTCRCMPRPCTCVYYDEFSD